MLRAASSESSRGPKRGEAGAGTALTNRSLSRRVHNQGEAQFGRRHRGRRRWDSSRLGQKRREAMKLLRALCAVFLLTVAAVCQGQTTPDNLPEGVAVLVEVANPQDAWQGLQETATAIMPNTKLPPLEGLVVQPMSTQDPSTRGPGQVGPVGLPHLLADRSECVRARLPRHRREGVPRLPGARDAEGEGRWRPGRLQRGLVGDRHRQRRPAGRHGPRSGGREGRRRGALAAEGRALGRRRRLPGRTTWRWPCVPRRC